MNTCIELLRAGTATLADFSESPRIDAIVLLSKVTGYSRTKLLADPTTKVADDLCASYFEILATRRTGTPVAYITGEKEFYSLPFVVSPNVLIPRPETELLVGLGSAEILRCVSSFVAQSEIRKAETRKVRILDLGTGSGCIAISLAVELSKNQIPTDILAVDYSDEVLTLARKNAELLGVDNIRFAKSNWFSEVTGTFDLILSNPPYIPLNDPHTSPDTRFEPQTALFSGRDGCDAYREIFASVRHFLCPQGLFLGEHGITQGQTLAEMATGAGFSKGNVRVHRDLTDRDRIIACRK